MPEEMPLSNTAGLVLGLDEAGRGGVVGPLVVAGVVLDPQTRDKLRQLGVCDSKRLTPNRRRALVREIECVAQRIEICEFNADTVDRRYTEDSDLDTLEREAADEILTRVIPIGRVVADGQRLFEPLASKYPDLVFTANDHADAKHVSVAAASVIAKHRRDERLHRIMKPHAPDHGEVKGGGYGGDATERFLRAYFDRTGKLPPETRLSSKWKVIHQLVVRQLPREPSSS